MKSYAVMLEGKAIKMEADFLHIKDGIMCLYEKPKYGGQPWIIAAFSPPAQVYEVENES